MSAEHNHPPRCCCQFEYRQGELVEAPCPACPEDGTEQAQTTDDRARELRQHLATIDGAVTDVMGGRPIDDAIGEIGVSIDKAREIAATPYTEQETTK
jgi:hypothetical protein